MLKQSVCIPRGTTRQPPQCPPLTLDPAQDSLPGPFSPHPLAPPASPPCAAQGSKPASTLDHPQSRPPSPRRPLHPQWTTTPFSQPVPPDSRHQTLLTPPPLLLCLRKHLLAPSSWWTLNPHTTLSAGGLIAKVRAHISYHTLLPAILC
jgi:hypothetical protein